MTNAATGRVRVSKRLRHRTMFVLALLGLVTVIVTACARATEHEGPVNITVRAENEVYPFSNNLRGLAMNNWNWLWGGIAEIDSPRRLALIEAAKQLNPGVIRFAGGLWANSVGWDRGGVAPENGEWKFIGDNGESAFDYLHAYKPAMIDSYAAFAAKIGADTIMQINICDNNIPMWTDLLRYTNIENDYGFRYWEPGNEIDLAECISRDEYAKRFVEYSKALKAVDPSIMVLGPSVAEPSRTDWYEALTSPQDGGPDVLSFHWYQLTRWNDDPTTFSYQGGSQEALFSHSIAIGESCQSGFGCPGDEIPLRKLDRITNRRGMAEGMKQEVFDPARAGSPGMLTAITEIGVHSSRHTLPINGSHVAALWLADMLGRWAYNGLDIMTYFSFEDGADGPGQSRGLVGMDGRTVLDVRPTYITEWLYARHFGDVMVESETNYFDQRVVAWASTDSDDPGSLKLMMVNLTDRTEVVNLNVSGFEPATGEAWVMASSDPLSDDNPKSFTEHTSKVNGVAIPDVEIAGPEAFGRLLESIQPVQVEAAPRFQYTVEPYSVVALTLRSPRS